MDKEGHGPLEERDREAIQREAQEIANEFEALGARLRTLHGSLPVSPREDLMHLGEEDPDYSCIVRGAIECVLNDQLGLLVETLRTAVRSEAE